MMLILSTRDINVREKIIASENLYSDELQKNPESTGWKPNHQNKDAELQKSRYYSEFNRVGQLLING